MLNDPAGRLMPRLLTFVVWALLAASAAYWLLGASKVANPTALPVGAVPPQADTAAVARLFGRRGEEVKAPAPKVTDNRFALAGVIARGGAGGAALIAVDGRPAQPYRVGSEVDPGLVLKSVQARSAILAPAGKSGAGESANGKSGDQVITIELPELKGGGMSYGAAR